jgi:hypothetical protein
VAEAGAFLGMLDLRRKPDAERHGVRSRRAV